MALDIQSSIPHEVRAGDTVRWRRELADYPASDGWILAYTLVGSASVKSISATADGDAFSVAIPAATSAAWEPGAYRVQETVTKGAERYTLCTVTLRVLQNLAALTAGADLRTHARKVLDAIEAWLESKAPTASSIEIAGRKISNYPLPELLALRDRYRAEVRREEAGSSSGRGSRLLMRL